MRHTLLPSYSVLRRALALKTGNDQAAIRSFDRKFQELEDDQEVSATCAFEQLWQEFDDCLPMEDA